MVGVPYKVLFVGLGSIGIRHLTNLLELKSDCKIDALRRSGKDFPNVSKIYTTYGEIRDDYDIIFITNPTSLHFEAISNLANKGENLFIEKPIFEKPHICKFSKGINYVACPLRYNSVVTKLKQYVESHNVFSFRAICSSYLPDWRNAVDYRSSYSAKRDMGGGVELDLIHEMDYLRWIFGDFREIKKLSGKKSNLDISSNDIAVYLFENERIMGSLHLDYFGRKAKREIEIYTPEETKTFDLTKFKDDMYKSEMQYFLTMIDKQNKDCYNPPEFALETLRMALV